MSVPKGAKFAAGYRDRALDRRKAEVESDTDAATDRKGKAAGGDVSTTHLVKGLDRRLLERVKRGEDVMSAPAGDRPDLTDESGDDDDEGCDSDNGAGNEKSTSADRDDDIDTQLDQLIQQEIAPVVREQEAKVGQRVQKRSRAEILAALKASRQKPVVVGVQLGSKFRRIGDGDQSGRVRSGQVKPTDRDEEEEAQERDRLDRANALGREVDDQVRAAAAASEKDREADDDSDDDDIFAGVGAEYDPLGSEPESSDSECDNHGGQRHDREADSGSGRAGGHTNGNEADSPPAGPAPAKPGRRVTFAPSPDRESSPEPATQARTQIRSQTQTQTRPVKRDWFGTGSGKSDEVDEQLKAELDPLAGLLTDPAIAAAVRSGRRHKSDDEDDDDDDEGEIDEGEGADATPDETREMRRLGLGFRRSNDLDPDLDDGDDDEDDGGGKKQVEKPSRRERAKKRREKEAKGSAAAVMELVQRRRAPNK